MPDHCQRVIKESKVKVTKIVQKTLKITKQFLIICEKSFSEIEFYANQCNGILSLTVNIESSISIKKVLPTQTEYIMEQNKLFCKKSHLKYHPPKIILKQFCFFMMKNS